MSELMNPTPTFHTNTLTDRPATKSGCSFRKQRTSVAVGVIMMGLMIGASGGCTNTSKREAMAITGATEITASTPLAIDISNEHGSVIVEVSPKFEKLSVWARASGDTKEARTPDFAGAEVVMDEGRPVLRIVGANPNAVDGAGKYLQIRVQSPACAGIRIRNDGGPVRVTGVSGAIDIENSTFGVSGGTTVIATKPVVDPVRIVTRSGGIDFRMPADSRGTVSAGVHTGTIRGDVGESKLSNLKATDRSWSGVINAPGNTIELRSDTGDVLFMYGRK